MAGARLSPTRDPDQSLRSRGGSQGWPLGRGEDGGNPPAPLGWDLRGPSSPASGPPAPCPSRDDSGRLRTAPGLRLPALPPPPSSHSAPFLAHILRAGQRPPLSAGGKDRLAPPLSASSPSAGRGPAPRPFESGSPPSGSAGRRRRGGCEGRAAVEGDGTGPGRLRPLRLCGGGAGPAGSAEGREPARRGAAGGSRRTAAGAGLRSPHGGRAAGRVPGPHLPSPRGWALPGGWFGRGSGCGRDIAAAGKLLRNISLRNSAAQREAARARQGVPALGCRGPA